MASARREPLVVIDPYLIDLRLEGDLPIPQSYRERVRAIGPSTHPDLGVQAEGRGAGRGRAPGVRRRPLQRPPRPDPEEVSA